jgi:uncharacterized protein YecT (DUF1311 family)
MGWFGSLWNSGWENHIPGRRWGLPLGLALSLVALPGLQAQDAPSLDSGPLLHSPAPKKPAAEAEAAPPEPPAAEIPGPAPIYSKAIFQHTVPPAELAFLRQYAGARSGDLYRDKQFRHLLHSEIPGWMFHYGYDMSLPDALDSVLDGSRLPVEVRDGRYVSIAGQSGTNRIRLDGRGFVWVDMQEGIVIGGFFFHPTNGEPTPTVTIFTREIHQDTLTLRQLPPAFAEDLARWSAQSGIPPLTTRYFIGDIKERILLEHDEDFCSPETGVAGPMGADCEQMTADAADMDMNTAYYLDQVHYATNATAWMIVGPEETAWIELRDRTCGRGPDPLGCHIRMTREHIHRILLPRNGRR